MLPDPNPDNFSLAPPRAVNAGPLGSGAVNGSLADGEGSSEPLTATGGGRDLAVSRITAVQKSLVTTEQLVACGLGADAVTYRLKCGRFHVVFRGVYTVCSGELPPLALELAALLACGHRTLISHHSAAFVWGLCPTPPADVEVSVVQRCCKSREGIRVHRIQKIHRDELRRHEGLWVSSPARAVLEVAQVLGDEDAMTITRSRAEKAFLQLIRDARLPAPQTNQRLGRYFPDFMWREQRLIVELDSYQFHGGPGGFQNDHEKDFVYRDAGFDVLRPTRNHVIHEPARVLVSVVRALERSGRA
ncbi:MAG TPA: DUF559 domain-containing protein [Solirubrobacteraceae bacterium]|nr:DUF559 domain-containing protein [Solirubrobacteraceae bacterium]